MLNVKKLLTAKPKDRSNQELKPLFTPWGQELLESKSASDSGGQDIVPLPEHPRPQARRDTWLSLNGAWTCAFTEDAPHPQALPLALPGKKPPAEGVTTPILVPFSPEAPLSGVNRQLQPHELLWYRRGFATPAIPAGWRLVLHFEAVDHACAVWLNGRLLGTHVGGYLPFSFDITDAVVGEAAPDAAQAAPDAVQAASTTPHLNQLCLCVADPSDAGTQLRGKQRLNRGDIWYTAQSGIWQPVWLEWMPPEGVGDFSLDAQLDLASGGGRLRVTGEADLGVTVRDAAGVLVAQGVVAAKGAVASQSTVATRNTESAATTQAALEIGAVRPWSPDDPYLYQVELTRGQDVVRSYCGFRTVEVRRAPDGHKRVFVNGKQTFLKGVLDQGYWPDGLMTAPSDEALVHDIVTMRAAGFNLLRKHIKVENTRWYFHADRLGMLVWQDMVCGGGSQNVWHTSYKPTLFKASWGSKKDSTPTHWRHLQAEDAAYRKAWTSQMEGTIQLLQSHPSVIAWVLFNEGWGQFDAALATKAARALDPTRPINSVTGWYDQHCGDFKSVHNYFRDQAVWPDADRGRAFVVGEFGGLTLAVPGHMVLDDAYGYETFKGGEAWRKAVRGLLDQMSALETKGLAGYVYTQLSDVEEEVNGLLTYDRRVNKLVD